MIYQIKAYFFGLSLHMYKKNFQSLVYKMSAKKELSIRQRVGNFYMKNKQLKKSLIATHFLFEVIPKSSVYSIIDRVEKGISLDRKPGSDHSVSDKDLIIKIKKGLKNMPTNVCQRLMKGLKTKMRKVADNGVLSVIN
jgi:hypothetical protein